MTLPALDFFGLQSGSTRGTWVLPVDRGLTSGSGALFGGAALGAVTAVVEAATGRPLVWVTLQFVAHVVPPADVVVEVSELARGRRASQVRVHARVGNRSVFEAMGGTGERREGGSEATGVVRPDVPSPEECPPRPVVDRHRGRFMARSQARLARTGPSPDGRSAVWVRFPELEPGAATLAASGDYVPFGLRQVIGDGFATHSLDNTLRMRRAPGSGWVLADIVIEGVTGGFGHGSVRLWDESGELLATASQSFTCRPRPD